VVRVGTSAADLEKWVRTEMGLPPEATVEISERPGTDPRCSDVVTQVAVTSPGETPYSFHIEHPLADLVPMDLVAALAFGGGH
jgi:hypothetical protein